MHRTPPKKVDFSSYHKQGSFSLTSSFFSSCKKIRSMGRKVFDFASAIDSKRASRNFCRTNRLGFCHNAVPDTSPRPSIR